MRPDTIALRDRVLAVLRDAEGPLSTNEVCARAGRFLERRPGCVSWHHDPNHFPTYELLECDGRTHLLALDLINGQRGYRILCQLLSKGRVRRQRLGAVTQVVWTYVRRDSDVDVAALEALLEDAS